LHLATIDLDTDIHLHTTVARHRSSHQHQLLSGHHAGFAVLLGVACHLDEGADGDREELLGVGVLSCFT
jgi:hypothetical protein